MQLNAESKNDNLKDMQKIINVKNKLQIPIQFKYYDIKTII